MFRRTLGLAAATVALSGALVGVGAQAQANDNGGHNWRDRGGSSWDRGGSSWDRGNRDRGNHWRGDWNRSGRWNRDNWRGNWDWNRGGGWFGNRFFSDFNSFSSFQVCVDRPIRLGNQWGGGSSWDGGSWSSWNRSSSFNILRTLNCRSFGSDSDFDFDSDFGGGFRSFFLG